MHVFPFLFLSLIFIAQIFRVSRFYFLTRLFVFDCLPFLILLSSCLFPVAIFLTFLTFLVICLNDLLYLFSLQKVAFLTWIQNFQLNFHCLDTSCYTSYLYHTLLGHSEVPHSHASFEMLICDRVPTARPTSPLILFGVLAPLFSLAVNLRVHIFCQDVAEIFRLGRAWCPFLCPNHQVRPLTGQHLTFVAIF